LKLLTGQTLSGFGASEMPACARAQAGIAGRPITAV
jgi:hypothetical protein